MGGLTSSAQMACQVRLQAAWHVSTHRSCRVQAACMVGSMYSMNVMQTLTNTHKKAQHAWHQPEVTSALAYAWPRLSQNGVAKPPASLPDSLP